MIPALTSHLTLRRAIASTAAALLLAGGLSVVGAPAAKAADNVVTPLCPRAAIVGHPIPLTPARDKPIGTVRVNGSLPPELILNNDFEYAGTPTAVGTFNFVVTSSYPREDGSTGQRDTICQMLVKPEPTVTRIEGADRYQTAVATSARMFTTSPIVYVVSGEKFADALSASGVAGIHDAPILLAQSGAVPAEVLAEIRRLGATDIGLVGGALTLSPAVEAQLATTGARVTRIVGEDRYAVSRNLLANPLFGNSASKAPTLVSGLGFPDALTAGPAATHTGQSVLLLNGASTSLTPAEMSFFQSSGFTSAHVVGGPASFTGDLARSASMTINPDGGIGPRVYGPDRYATGVAVNEAFTSSGRVYVASGVGFADALSGGAAAGHDDSPLFIVPTGCIPSSVLTAIYHLAPSEVVLLGGPSTLSPAVQALTPCP